MHAVRLFGPGGDVDVYCQLLVQPVATDTQQLGDRMRRAWANFARTGNPGWHRFSPAELQTMVYDNDSREQPYPHALTLQAYSQHPLEILDLPTSAPADGGPS